MIVHHVLGYGSIFGEGQGTSVQDGSGLTKKVGISSHDASNSFTIQAVKLDTARRRLIL